MFSLFLSLLVISTKCLEISTVFPDGYVNAQINKLGENDRVNKLFEKLEAAKIVNVEIPVVYNRYESQEILNAKFDRLKEVIEIAKTHNVVVIPTFSVTHFDESNQTIISFLTTFKKDFGAQFSDSKIKEIKILFDEGRRPKIRTDKQIEEIIINLRKVFSEEAAIISSTIPRGIDVTRAMQLFQLNKICISNTIEYEQFAEVLIELASQNKVQFLGTIQQNIGSLLNDKERMSEIAKTVLKLAEKGMKKVTFLNTINSNIYYNDDEWANFLAFIGLLQPATEARNTVKSATTYVSASNSNFDGDLYNSIIMYQVMVSTFQNGDDSKGYGTGYGPSDHKGDLRGIINALDYIKGLGVNALWMTPVFDSSQNTRDRKLQSTGYFADDYFNIDPNFGSNEIFRELVNKAHEKGLYVILDGVFGHHGGNIRQSPNGKYPQGGQDPVSYPGSLDFYKEVATYWINNYEIDGWRLDQCYQMNQNGHNYMREIREAVEGACNSRKDQGKQWGTLGYIVGEDWNGESAIQSHTYSQGGLRSAFDFPSRYRLVQSIACEESYKGGYGADNMIQIFKAPNEKGYSHELGYIYPNLFITNHDVFRFGNLIKNKYGYGPENGDYWKRYKLAIGCLAAYTGPITLYYGDEAGDIVECWPNCGANVGADNMARTSGHINNFNSNAQNMHDYTAKLMNLRKQYPCMWRGNNNPYNVGSCLVDIKWDQKTGQKIVFIANIGTNSQNVNVNQGNMKDLITGNTYGSSVNIDGLTCGIYLVQ